jgi:hypothetical protein
VRPLSIARRLRLRAAQLSWRHRRDISRVHCAGACGSRRAPAALRRPRGAGNRLVVAPAPAGRRRREQRRRTGSVAAGKLRNGARSRALGSGAGPRSDLPEWARAVDRRGRQSPARSHRQTWIDEPVANPPTSIDELPADRAPGWPHRYGKRSTTAAPAATEHAMRGEPTIRVIIKSVLSHQAGRRARQKFEYKLKTRLFG